MLYDIEFSFNTLLNDAQFVFTCERFSCSNVLVQELHKLQMPHLLRVTFTPSLLCSVSFVSCLCASVYGSCCMN